VNFIGAAWSEGPLLLELHRLSLGGPAYTPPAELSAYDYGPVYVVVLNGLRAIVGQPVDLAVFRLLTIALGVLAMFPVGVAAAAVARRAGSRSRPVLLAAAAAGGLLGLDVLAHNLTFEKVHPDNLVFVLVAGAVAVHFAIAARMVRPRFAWAIVICGVAGAFTKQNAGAVAPLLLAGLAAAGTITWRRFSLHVVTYAALVAGCVLAMPQAMRAWTVWIPLAHRYQFTAEKFSDAAAALTTGGPYLCGTIIVTLFVLAVLSRRAGNRALWIDAAALAAVVSAALPAYFKELGIFNNLTILAAATAPYTGAAVGLLYAWAREAGGLRAVMLMLLLGTLLTASLARFDDRSAPAIGLAEQRNVARMEALADALCAGNRTVFVYAPLSEFFRCRSARFALSASLTELRLAFPRYDAGPTVFDRPVDTDFFVGPDIPDPPDPWLAGYHRIDPPITGNATAAHNLHVVVYERNR
jgi:hypothetical protein